MFVTSCGLGHHPERTEEEADPGGGGPSESKPPDIQSLPGIPTESESVAGVL